MQTHNTAVARSVHQYLFIIIKKIKWLNNKNLHSSKVNLLILRSFWGNVIKEGKVSSTNVKKVFLCALCNLNNKLKTKFKNKNTRKTEIRPLVLFCPKISLLLSLLLYCAVCTFFQISDKILNRKQVFAKHEKNVIFN